MDVREPVVAGTFYERDPAMLKDHLGRMFRDIGRLKKYSLVVSPHAGYLYSGRTAAFAVSGLTNSRSFIILGPNHTGLGSPFSIMSSGSWRTPLGECRIDADMAREVKACTFVEEDSLAHMNEHSIEVQLPLLQHRFGDFRFVPVCIMNTGYSETFLEECISLGKIVAGIVKGDKAGVIASSDFSHYLPKEKADEKDRKVVEKILKLDVPGMFRTLQETDASVCGFGPIAVAMAAAKKLRLKPLVINKSSSGDASGDYGSVVTYYAIGFTAEI